MSHNYKNQAEVDQDVDHVKYEIANDFHGQHPTDKATSYRAIETWAGDQATRQEEANAENGVPERSEDG